MLSILLNLSFIFSVLMWILALLAGTALTVTAYHSIFRLSAIYAEIAEKVTGFLILTVICAVTGSSATVILHRLIGGGINAH